MDFVLAVGGLFDRGFDIAPDPVTIVIVPALAAIGGLFRVFVSIVVSRGRVVPAAPPMDGALVGAGLGLLYLVLGLLR